MYGATNGLYSGKSDTKTLTDGNKVSKAIYFLVSSLRIFEFIVLLKLLMMKLSVKIVENHFLYSAFPPLVTILEFHPFCFSPSIVPCYCEQDVFVITSEAE